MKLYSLVILSLFVVSSAHSEETAGQTIKRSAKEAVSEVKTAGKKIGHASRDAAKAVKKEVIEAKKKVLKE